MVDNEDLTVDKILNNEHLKDLAEKIVDGTIDKIVIIYRDKASSTTRWQTSIDSWAEVIGLLVLTKGLVIEEWLTHVEKEQ